jgi:hypothetical protein
VGALRDQPDAAQQQVGQGQDQQQPVEDQQQPVEDQQQPVEPLRALELRVAQVVQQLAVEPLQSIVTGSPTRARSSGLGLFLCASRKPPANWG